MDPFRSILVDVDAGAAAHPALDRAVRLARGCGARLEIVDVLTIPGEARRQLGADLADELVARRREQLARLAAGVTGVAAESTLLQGRPGTALIRHVLRSGHDLIVRAHARDLVAAPRPFGAVDMELFRKCPCPVLVVGPGAVPEHPRIVGAVHAGTDDREEEALNAKIAALTLLIARVADGTPALLHAWEPFAERMIRSRVSEGAFADYEESARRRADEDLARLVGSLPDAPAGLEVIVRRGEPETVIPELVVERGVDLVVMGTVARAGITGLLIGNTAERVLRRLPSSVLTVKPDGFVSPVRLDR